MVNLKSLKVGDRISYKKDGIMCLKVGDRISYKKDGIMCLWIGEIIEIFPNACKVKHVTGTGDSNITYVPNNSIYDKEIKETTMNTRSKSYTFTREEIISVMRDGVIEMLKDSVEELVNGEVNISFFESWRDIDKKDTDELIEWWCSIYWDKFFKDNPDVDDALILIEKNGETIKQWMASR